MYPVNYIEKGYGQHAAVQAAGHALVETSGQWLADDPVAVQAIMDAYTLAPRLNQLKALPDTRIDGLTGQLSMSSSQRIQRQLPWAEFRDGQVQRLP